MTRREALAKATLATSDVTAGLLRPEQSTQFIRVIKDKGALSAKMRQEIRTASSGEIDLISTAKRLIRRATENTDDGYRAGAAFNSVGYQTVKVRLPWEVTEDVFHENIEQEQLEATLTDEMTTQFALDLEDLEINGDTAAPTGPDQAFLQINDGLLKQIAAGAASYPGRNIDATTINGGVFSKDHLFETLFGLPNKYRTQPGLVWIMSPNRKIQWWEQQTNRATPAGDTALFGQGAAIDQPLGISILTVPAWPDDVIVLADPANFVRVITWDIRKRRVTGETDADLAALDKRFYVFFIKHDVIVEQLDALVRLYNLPAIT